MNENPSSRDVMVLLGSDSVGCGDASSLDSGNAQMNFLAVEREGEKPGSIDGTMSSCKLGAMDIDGLRKIGSLDLSDIHANPSPFTASAVPEGEKLVEEGKLKMCEGFSQVDEYCSPRSSPMNQYGNHEFDAGFHRGERLPNSVLGVLMRVLSGEAGNLKRKVDFFIVAIHASMLESGFLGRLPCVWSAESTVSISYSLGNFLAHNDVQNMATLKIEFFPDYVVVYGRLSDPSSKLHRIALKFSYGPSIRAFVEQMKETDSSYVSHNGKMVIELWKAFKDNISLPLLHELCDRTGLPRPTCLGCLPSELKLDVLERLGPIDLAKMERVSVEFRNLSSENELWRKKYEEMFGSTAVDCERSWKRRFAESWSLKKRREATASSRNRRAPTWYPFPPPRRARIEGSDYDWFPIPLTWGGSCPFGRNRGSYMGRLGDH